MIGFDKAKVGFVLALLACMFAIHPVVDKFKAWGFDIFGFSLTIDMLYILFVLLLAFATYLYAVCFITQKPYTTILWLGNTFYAIALIVPPTYLVLFICTEAAEFTASWINQEPVKIVLQCVLGAFASMCSALMVYGLHQLLSARDMNIAISQLEKEEESHILRAAEMQDVGHLYIVVLESFRAIQAALSKLLLNSSVCVHGWIPSAMASAAVKAGIISEEVFEMINKVLVARNRSVHEAQEWLTQDTAKEVLDITRRVLAELEKANRINILQQSIKLCPVGDGPLYVNLVGDVIRTALAGIIDFDLVRTEVQLAAGTADIELPLCPKMLSKYPLWERWYQEFKIESIIVEVKNTQKRTGIEGVMQLIRYLNTAKKGKFGIFVSRTGFTQNAMRTIRSVANERETLILPLDQNDLIELLKLSIQSTSEVVRLLRRIETILRHKE